MRLIIDGDPIAQIRMKYSGRNGIGRMYDPRQKEKTKLKDIIKRCYGSNPIFIHPRVSFVFHMPIPKSIPNRLLSLYQSGFLKHEKKPDVDNFIKLYLDCMDIICFDGDQKVSLGPSVKLYHPHPKTIIIINESTPLLSPLEVDPSTFLLLFSEESAKQSSCEMEFLPDSYAPTALESWQCPGMIYPQQQVSPSEQLPFALQQWEQVHRASLQFPSLS